MKPRQKPTNKHFDATGLGQAELLFEVCEQRLVLSAQLLAELIAEPQPMGTLDSVPFGPQLADSQTGLDARVAIQPQLNDAHVATGLDVVQQQFGLNGRGQTVAVIDSGIAWDHVALGEGYGPGYRVVGGWDFAENDDQPYDDGPTGFHGTHVGGIIGSDSPDHLGVAPGADLVALRVFSDSGEGRLEWVEKALQWVHDNQDSFENPITTVNISIGTVWNSDSVPSWGTLEDELKLLYDDGIVVTAAAGNSFQTYNETGLSYPAASQYVLPVSSVDDDGSLSDFSQRNSRVLAAPGGNITSSVPDHVLGRDGQIDDYIAASGTSMASPYVAGASVLVRQAMEMTGWESINASTITEHLHSTADRIFDTLTGLNYDRLDLQQAIESLLPVDDVGNATNNATAVTLGPNGSIDTWINTLGDTDVYRFTASANGSLSLDASSDWLNTLQWSLTSSGREIGSGQLEAATLNLIAGQSYELHVSAADAIGPLSIDLQFHASNQSGGEGSGSQTDNSTPLGSVDYYEESSAAGTGYSIVAARDGILTVEWTNPDSPSGSLVTTRAGGEVIADSTWADGALRVDIPVNAGQSVQVTLPGSASDTGNLAIANVVSQVGSTATVSGTLEQDTISLDLSDGASVTFGSIDYVFAPGEVTRLEIDGNGNNDVLQITGSAGSDKVDLRPGQSNVDSQYVQATISNVEQIDYQSGGGADRVYLYDSDQDDTLRARPSSAELVGVGYRFAVSDVDRIFIHATGGGQDYAYLYDSSGDDRLNVRPQFSSMAGDGFFNYVRGFERVYAYANHGGEDVANLYDSEFDDRFSTSGVSASMVGAGFSSFTRSFEQVNAYATAGGDDLATLYGGSGQTQWEQGSDFVGFREGNWAREARGFERVESYEQGQAFQLSTLSVSENTALWTSPSSDASLETNTEPLTLLGPEQGEQAVFIDLESQAAVQAQRLHLPEEDLMSDPELEQDILHEAFRQFDELFDDLL